MAYTYDDGLNFIASLYCPARIIADRTGCSWQLILAQAAGETQWGKSVLRGTHNVFNIKADGHWSGPSGSFYVWEMIRGRKVWMWDKFRIYSSYQESLDDRMKFLEENSRYHELRDDSVKGDYRKEAHALQDAGYATDPLYAEKLIEIAEGPSMRRAVARGQSRGCAAVLPVMQVHLLDGAKVRVPHAPVRVTQGGKTVELATGYDGYVVVRYTPSGGDIQLKAYDKVQAKWIDLDPIKLEKNTVGKDVTLIAPTFTAQTTTRQHVKSAAANSTARSSAANAQHAASTPHPAVSTPDPAPAPRPSPPKASSPPAPTAGASRAPHTAAAVAQPSVIAPHPSPAPHPQASTAAAPGANDEVPNFRLHTVRKRESLSLIAEQYGVRYQAIAQANGISSPYIIRPDQILKIPNVQSASPDEQKHVAEAPSAPAQQASAKSVPTPAVKDAAPKEHAKQPATANKTASPTGPRTTPVELGRILKDGSSRVDTVYLRNAAEHPQTDLMHSTRAPWMEKAQEEFEKGVRRRPGREHDPRILEYFKATSLEKKYATQDETAYCAAFANWCLGRAGFVGTKSALALSFLKWGRQTRGNKPALGAVAVIRFEDGSPHVTFVAGIARDGRICTLGGNQGRAHEVSHSYLPRRVVLQYRYPADYRDYDDDYVLHHVDSDSAPMTGASTR